jgi:hydroxymethylpyrimidine pyrophosphatase-like HAD family hydrolase
LPVIAITGRPAGWSEPFAMDWPVAAIVAENGAVMLRRVGTQLQRDFTQGEATRAAHRLRLQQCASAVLAAVPHARLARDSSGRLTDIAVDHSEFERLSDTDIDAVLSNMHAHGLKASVSSIHVNGWIGEHDKWSGARWAVERALGLPFEASQWLYVGDSTNDQLMFEHLPLSVAVANIRRFLPQLTVLPAYVTPSERGRGFAEVVQRLLHAKRRT